MDVDALSRVFVVVWLFHANDQAVDRAIILVYWMLFLVRSRPTLSKSKYWHVCDGVVCSSGTWVTIKMGWKLTKLFSQVIGDSDVDKKEAKNLVVQYHSPHILRNLLPGPVLSLSTWHLSRKGAEIKRVGVVSHYGIATFSVLKQVILNS